MNKKSVLVPEGTFRSKLLPIAAVLLSVAALSAILTILSVLLPGGFSVFQATAATEKMKDAMSVIHSMSDRLTIADVTGDVTMTWTIIHAFSILFAAAGSVSMTIGLLLAKRGDFNRGAEVIDRGAKFLYYLTTAAGIAAAVLFLIRAVPYIFVDMMEAGGAGFLFALPCLMFEIVLAALTCFIILKLRRFLDRFGDCAFSISRTLASGILRYPAIPTTSAVGCLLLGLSGLLLAWNRISTICSCGYSAADTLILYFSAAMFLFGGAAAILLFFCLRSYKRSSEYLLYKGTPVEDESAASN
ncbi:MAG: hypothetical protein IKM11_04725 [Oscillospiraceae bacterium]|nr:hypothetical protein [Oscillospiraceae bacterium]